jgi:hypothetical protein
MHRPDQPVVPPGATPTSQWRRRALDAGWVAFIAMVILTELMTGLIG